LFWQVHEASGLLFLLLGYGYLYMFALVTIDAIWFLC
jgi:hypothetical protein